MKLKIKDMNDAEIEIENLDLAIAIAEQYIGYHGNNEEFEGLHRKLREYWSDILEKLKALK